MRKYIVLFTWPTNREAYWQNSSSNAVFSMRQNRHCLVQFLEMLKDCVYFVSWSKSTGGTILPSINHVWLKAKQLQQYFCVMKQNKNAWFYMGASGLDRIQSCRIGIELWLKKFTVRSSLVRRGLTGILWHTLRNNGWVLMTTSYFFLLFRWIWWRQLAARRSLNCASCQGSWVNALAQEALRQFTQWLWIEHPNFHLKGGHITTELLLPFLLIFTYLTSQSNDSASLNKNK